MALMAAVIGTAFTSPAAANNWTVQKSGSRIAFSGTHAGQTFKGVFERWEAAITFDPANLPAAKVVVTVDLASAKTGDRTFDGTLPGADWLNITQSPTATFAATAITSRGGSAYEAVGLLTIRGIQVPVSLAFDLTIEGDTARLKGATRLKRLDFGIGKGSDATGSWVSLDVPLEVTVVATRG
jgi:polyisoprenoid-binding protein YceI